LSLTNTVRLMGRGAVGRGQSRWQALRWHDVDLDGGHWHALRDCAATTPMIVFERLLTVGSATSTDDIRAGLARELRHHRPDCAGRAVHEDALPA
jgi:hypothetical protein